MADEDTNTGAGDVDGRIAEDRRAFADIVLHWAATVAALRFLVDSWDISISAMCESRDAGQRDDRDRQVVAALKTIAHIERAQTLSTETIAHLRDLVASLQKVRKP